MHMFCKNAAQHQGRCQKEEVAELEGVLVYVLLLCVRFPGSGVLTAIEFSEKLHFWYETEALR